MKTINLIIYGNPVTKKNHMSLIKVHGRLIPIQSKAYREYEKNFITQCPEKYMINTSCNICCKYFMQTHRKVDLTNLLSATMDCLVKAGVIEDDNYLIASANDGSRVYFDTKNPRVEITISNLSDTVDISQTLQMIEIHNNLKQVTSIASH